MQELETRAVSAPNKDTVCFHLGNIYLAEKRFDDAAASFEKALAANQSRSEAHNNLAITMIHMGDYDGAIFHLKKAIELKPQSAEARGTLSTALAQKGRMDEAVMYLNEAKRIAPEMFAPTPGH
jgi:tetratricopeptide (TPR) repeat protein